MKLMNLIFYSAVEFYMVRSDTEVNPMFKIVMLCFYSCFTVVAFRIPKKIMEIMKSGGAAFGTNGLHTSPRNTLVRRCKWQISGSVSW